MKLKALLIILGLIPTVSFSQQSYFRLPRDSNNTPLIAGLGEPYLFEPTGTSTTYIVGQRVAIPLTGNDALRQYRHISVFNASTTRTVYICVGDGAGCTRDWYKARPSQGFVDDFTYFGVGDAKTHIYYRIDSAGTAAFDLRIW